MKIVFPWASYWPYVRRGAERYVHNLATYLAGRGHTVDIITSKPGPPRTAYDEKARVIYLRRMVHPLIYQYARLLWLYAFCIRALPVLLRGNYDVAHLWSYSGMWAAPLLREFRQLPYLFHIIAGDHLWPGRLDRWLFDQLIVRADRVLVLNRGHGEAVRQEFGVQAEVPPAAVDMSTFRPQGTKDPQRPYVLFTGDVLDRRKGASLLMRAWDEVYEHCPQAVLRLAAPIGMAGFDPGEFGRRGSFPWYQPQEAIRERLPRFIRNPRAREAVEIPGPGALADLPRQYSQAAVTVLPSIDEAGGMALLESLACGTPVVCSSEGGPGEVVTDPSVGATVGLRDFYDLTSIRRADELAQAVLYAIELSRNPATVSRCREWAEQWSLERIGRRTEEIYQEIVQARRSPRAGALTGMGQRW